VICFPNAKINIGLNITSKRTDGYHNLETVFYPVPLTDILEFMVSENKNTIHVSGTNLKIPANENICIKAYNLLSTDYKLPPLDIYLHKNIPNGAGLGGGSADASFFLKELNNFFNLKIPDKKLMGFASRLGADCPFFIHNKPVYARGTGNVFDEIELDLSLYYIVIVKPDFSINTAEAFKNIVPGIPDNSLKELIKKPVKEWKNLIKNDFEYSLFSKYPQLSELKQKLYDLGAVYASMSGSGSAIYGLFTHKPTIKNNFVNMFVWESKL
jgi:4-diphosphocytidyl-2-C-methyl-D-erythritol kinase